MTKEENQDVALKLLHTADWHLGRRFPMFTEDQELRLTRARREVVSRILDLAESRGVDAVLCAGDLFDDPSPKKEWWSAVLDDFRSRSSWTRPVILLPGNHDPLVPNSVYQTGHSFRDGLPSFVQVVDRDDFKLELSDNAVLYSTPCRSHAGQQDPTKHIPDRETGDERIRIGLVHGQTFDIEGHQTNFPVNPDAARDRGLDYLALGEGELEELVSGLLVTAIFEGSEVLRPEEAAHELLKLPCTDLPTTAMKSSLTKEELDEVVDEEIFLDQSEAAQRDQASFEKAIDQLDQFMEDRALLLRRNRTDLAGRIESAEGKRDAGAISPSRGGRSRAPQAPLHRSANYSHEIFANEGRARRGRRRGDIPRPVGSGST